VALMAASLALLRTPLTPPPQPPAPTAASNCRPRAIVKDSDAKPAAAIAVRAAQPKLQIVYERIRRQVIAPQQEAGRILDTASARTAHHDHLVRGEIPEP